MEYIELEIDHPDSGYASAKVPAHLLPDNFMQMDYWEAIRLLKILYYEDQAFWWSSQRLPEIVDLSIGLSGIDTFVKKWYYTKV